MSEGRGGSMSLGAVGIVARLRSQLSVVVSLVVTTLLASFLLAAAPRLLEHVSDLDLRATVTDPPPAQRNVRVERMSRPTAGPADDVFGPIARSGETFAAREFPESVASVITDEYFVLESPQFSINPLPGEEAPHPFDMFIRFRYQDGIDEHSRVVAGELPEPREPVTMLIGDDCPLDSSEREELTDQLDNGGEVDDPEFDCALQSVPAFEIAVSSETFDTLGIDLGQDMLLSPDPSDPLFFSLGGQALGYPVLLSISGLVELTDAAGEYWYGDPALHRPSIRETADFRIIFATGLAAPDAFRELLATTGEASWAQAWRHFVDPDLIVDSDLDVLQEDLRKLEVEFSPISTIPAEMRVITQLSNLLSEHAAQRQQTVAMLSLAIAGLFAVATAVLFLLAVLMTERQDRSIVLTRNRGASRAQLIMTRLYESLILVTPSAIAGYLTAKTVLPVRNDLSSYRAVVSLATVAVTLIVLAGIPRFTQRLGALQTDNVEADPSSARRVVFEVLAAVIGVGAVVVLRRRGLAEDNGVSASFDALLALTPVVVGVLAGLLLLRVFPLMARTAAKVASVFRGAVAFVGLRRLLQRPIRQHLPMVVVVICMSIATLASITKNSITNGLEASSWQSVGADYSVQGFRPEANIPTRVDIGALDSDGSVALARLEPRTRVESETGFVNVDVLAIETARYEALSAEAPGRVDIPPALSKGADGTLDDPLPVVVSEAWPGAVDASVGDRLELDLGRSQPVVAVVGTLNRFPTIPPGKPFIVVDLGALESMSDLPLPPTVALLRGPRTVQDDMHADLSDQSQSARLVSRYDFIDTVADDPFVSWSTVALDIIFWFALVFGVVAAVSALALSTAIRQRDLAYLRTIGIDDAQTTALTFIEQLPGAAVGTFTGLAAGAVSALLLAPAIVLDGFTGNLTPTGLVVDWSQLLALAIALVGALTLATSIFVLVNRHRDLGRLLRVGDNE